MTEKMKKTDRPMLRDSVEQIWLAGLGALAMTEQEGSRLFRNLVKQGEVFDKETRKRLDKAMSAAKEAPGNAVTRVEEGFDEAMNRVLHRLGVPTRTEIKSLTRRVEGLTESLEKRPAAKRTTTRVRTATTTPRTRTRRTKTAPPTATTVS